MMVNRFVHLFAFLLVFQAPVSKGLVIGMAFCIIQLLSVGSLPLVLQHSVTCAEAAPTATPKTSKTTAARNTKALSSSKTSSPKASASSKKSTKKSKLKTSATPSQTAKGDSKAAKTTSSPGIVTKKDSPPLKASIIRAHLVDPPAHSSLASHKLSKVASVPAHTVRGWNFLFSELVGEGIPEAKALSILSDPRMPKKTPVYFSITPRESQRLYSKVNTQKARSNALAFYSLHRETFLATEKKFSVPQEVILAILQVESSCGKNTGRERVFYRLARLASAAAPENISRNIQKLDKRTPQNIQAVMSRAKWLRNTFLPHVIGTISLSQSIGLHPLELKGSGGGAIGYFQFLPGNVTVYGADGDGDGKVNPHSPKDAILSVGRFLNSHGWNKTSLSRPAQREVILHYNRSEPYVDTVLGMASQLKREGNL